MRRPSLGATRPDPAPASDPGAASEHDQILVRFYSRRHAVRGGISVICLTCCAVKIEMRASVRSGAEMSHPGCATHNHPSHITSS